MQAIVLAGGLGTRLRSIVNDRPKPMAPIGDKPFLEYIIRNLKKQGIDNIVLAVGYMHEIIENYFEDGRRLGVKIQYSIEQNRLGTGGAIKNAERYLYDNNVVVLNGDTYFDIDFKEMYDLHIKNSSLFTMALRNVNDAQRYGAVEMTSDGRINRFIEKGKESSSTYINGGIYIIDKEILKLIQHNENISLENETIPLLLNSQKIYGYVSNQYFIDIGIPEDYERFCREIGGIKNDN